MEEMILEVRKSSGEVAGQKEQHRQRKAGVNQCDLAGGVLVTALIAEWKIGSGSERWG